MYEQPDSWVWLIDWYLRYEQGSVVFNWGLYNGDYQLANVMWGLDQTCIEHIDLLYNA